MLPTNLFQILTVAADLVIFLFVWYYLWNLHGKEKSIDKEQLKNDLNYHHIVDEALSKERKIINDATNEATQIISNTEFVTSASKESMDQALEKMEGEIEKQAESASDAFTKTYSTSLQKIAAQSLANLQAITKTMETELDKQSKEYRESLLPRLEKELEEYKKMRLQQAERTINHVIQEVTQEILNKSLSLDDHQRLLIESLEKAKKEGVFG
jgi:vacuolar-type H+-ATPase subunit H